MKNAYLLLTPGPLSTSESVREAMLKDWCTWDDDYNLEIVEVIRPQTRHTGHHTIRLHLGVDARQWHRFCRSHHWKRDVTH